MLLHLRYAAWRCIILLWQKYVPLKDSCLLECYTKPTGKRLLTFQRIIVPSSSGARHLRLRHYIWIFRSCGMLTLCHWVSTAAQPVTCHNISEDLNFQHHCIENLRSHMALQSFKAAVIIYQSAWCNTPKDFNLQQHCCENLKSYCVSAVRHSSDHPIPSTSSFP